MNILELLRDREAQIKKDLQGQKEKEESLMAEMNRATGELNQLRIQVATMFGHLAEVEYLQSEVEKLEE